MTGLLSSPPDGAGQGFARGERIRKRKEYESVYRLGTRRYSSHFIVVTCDGTSGLRRLGITVTKKAGNAVRRNRIKRLLREFFRLNKHRLTASQDTVVIANRPLPPLTYQDVYRELGRLLIKKTHA